MLFSELKYNEKTMTWKLLWTSLDLVRKHFSEEKGATKILGGWGTVFQAKRNSWYIDFQDGMSWCIWEKECQSG